MEKRRENRECQLMIDDIVNKYFPKLKNSSVKIKCLSSDLAKKSNGGLIMAECEKIADKNKWIIPYDFTITVFEPNCEGLSKEKLEILLKHELMHIGIKDNGKFYVKPHDVQEFKDIVEKYGIDWL